MWLQPILVRKISEEQNASPADAFPFLSPVMPLAIGMLDYEESTVKMNVAKAREGAI
jgi:hypothetical protein